MTLAKHIELLKRKKVYIIFSMFWLNIIHDTLSNIAPSYSTEQEMLGLNPDKFELSFFKDNAKDGQYLGLWDFMVTLLSRVETRYCIVSSSGSDLQQIVICNHDKMTASFATEVMFRAT